MRNNDDVQYENDDEKDIEFVENKRLDAKYNEDSIK